MSSRRALSQRLADLDRQSLSQEHLEIIGRLANAAESLNEDVGDLLPCALQDALELEPLRQTHRLEGPRIHTVTYVLLPGIDSARVEDALVKDEWNWWKHGKITAWERREDGGCRFVLAPVWPFVPSKVGIELEPPVHSEQQTPWGEVVPMVSYPARFFADFEGPGCYEILTLDGGSALRSKWEGVARLGFKKMMPLSMILNMHLAAEAGTASFPLPKGTGFPGLVDHLQSRPPSSTTSASA